jgi:hypothetical protein
VNQWQVNLVFNSNSVLILNLHPKGKLFIGSQYTRMQSLEIFAVAEEGILYFANLLQFGNFENVLYRAGPIHRAGQHYSAPGRFPTRPGVRDTDRSRGPFVAPWSSRTGVPPAGRRRRVRPPPTTPSPVPIKGPCGRSFQPLLLFLSPTLR